MAVLYRRAGCLTAKHGGFRPGQWGKFDPYASGYIYLFWLKRRVGELERPLGFDPDRERSQWRLLYLERCSDTSSAAGGGSVARSWATGSRRG